jgi:hypothetical protein
MCHRTSRSGHGEDNFFAKSFALPKYSIRSSYGLRGPSLNQSHAVRLRRAHPSDEFSVSVAEEISLLQGPLACLL